MSDDYTQDTATTAAITPGGSISGEIETAGDRDWIAVQLQSGRTYRFDLMGAPTGHGTLEDTFLRKIYDSDGNKTVGDGANPTYNDDTDGRNSRVTFTPLISGTYYIEVSGDRDETGTYTFSVTDLTPPEQTQTTQEQPTTDPPATPEPAATDDDASNPQTTGVLEVNGEARGTIEESGDRDRFAVTLTAGVTYQFDLRESSDNGLHDPFIYGIHDADGNLIEGTQNDNISWFFWNSRVFFTPEASGTYYISVGAGDDGTGDYDLSVTNIDNDDYPATTATTGTVTPGTPTTGEVNTDYEEDWFRVTLEAGATYRIEITGRSSGSGTLVSPMLKGLYDADGNLIPGSTVYPGGRGDDARLEFSPSESGTYYIGVGAPGIGTGTYGVEVTAIGRGAARDLGDITNPSNAVFLKEQIDAIPDDGAYYKFTLTEASVIEFGLRRQDRDADLLIEDEDGNVLHAGRRDGRANEAVRADLEAGTYYVHVHARERGVNDFILRYGPPTETTVQPDTDATPEGARGIQFFSGVATAGGKLDGMGDATDYVKFTLEQAKVVSLALSGRELHPSLDRDINMRLQDERGNNIRASAEKGRAGENIELMLDPGTYYVELTAYEAGDSPYYLQVTQSEPPRLSIGNTSTYEEEGAILRFPVTLDKASPREITAQWTTYELPSATATPGEDYQISSGTVTFAPGETEQWIEVPVIDDDIEDSGETVAVRIHSVVEAVIKTDNALGTITNRDLAADTTTEGRLEVNAAPILQQIDTRKDADWFEVELMTGETYYIDAKGVSSSHGTLPDPILRVYNEDGTIASRQDDNVDPDNGDPVVLQDDNGGSGRNARVVFTPEGTGELETYYVSVASVRHSKRRLNRHILAFHLNCKRRLPVPYRGPRRSHHRRGDRRANAQQPPLRRNRV